MQKVRVFTHVYRQPKVIIAHSSVVEILGMFAAATIAPILLVADIIHLGGLSASHLIGTNV